MATDPSALKRLCDEVFFADDESPGEAASRALRRLVDLDPEGCFEACRICAAAALADGDDGYEYSAIIDALRELDVAWLHRAIDLIPTEPAMWNLVAADSTYPVIIERLGIRTISRAWHENMRNESDVASKWASDLLFWDLDDRCDEATRRHLILQLVEDADDETIWVTAAWQVEEFITDDEDRLAWIENEAAINPKFRFALTGVWLSNKSAATAARVDRARNFEQK